MKNTKIKPIVVINFKTYKQGKDVINLAKAIESVDKNIIIGVQPSDIYIIKKNTKLKVYAQHVDYFDRGRNTGYILPEAVKSAGASGVFLNHSEHKIPLDIIEKSIERCKALGLKTLVFAKDTEEAKKVEIFNPDYIAVESPELVSGNISVSVARPELISDVSKNLKSKFLVGAGIKNFYDIEKSIKLGASGIAVSSAITTSINPKKALKELLGKSEKQCATPT